MSDNINNPDSNTPQDGESSEKGSEKDLKKEESMDREETKADKPASVPPAGPVPGSQDISKPVPPARPKTSNYQISLIDENYLKISVSTKKGIKINSTLRENRKNAEFQNNEIYLNPRIDLAQQEAEIHITIDENRDSEQKDTSDIEPKEKAKLNDNILEETDESAASKESKFKVSPVNENLLKVTIETDKSVRIDSVAKDKKTSLQTQSNRVLLLPDHENKIHLIEITIEIDAEVKDITEELKGSSADGKIKLIPNPEVVDLIQPPDYSEYPVDPGIISPDQGFKNPFDSLRHLIKKNLTIGIIVATILHLAAAAVAFYTIGRNSKDQLQEEPQRLIVIQDLPDPKIKLQDVEDPNKPKAEELPLDEEKNVKVPGREITPRKIVQPPKVKRPENKLNENDSTLEARLNRELDSLRRLADNLGNDSTEKIPDSLKINYEIPDSLRSNFNEQDIGLAMYFPKSWKLTDQRDINKNEKDFKGVVLTDTTAEQPGTMTMFIFLDKDLKDFNSEDFKTEFPMNDTTLSGFVKEPKTLAGFTEYRFYVFNKIGTEKLSLRASVRKQYFDQYKKEIEAVVRSINLRKNINKPDSTGSKPLTIPEDKGDNKGEENSGSE
ncbi:MAG: hypothetical protein JSS91_06720 [Bacteroidetes bacterium]|nr:hypothetical protein [Bacteroidota bacterium]